MPTNKYEVSCITCGHPVNQADPGVGAIRMAGQPRYYHLDPYACQRAEAKYNMYIGSREDMEMVTAE
jgi:hypothetical protein